MEQEITLTQEQLTQEQLNELEPQELALVTEVTHGDVSASGDDNIVWGNF